MTDCAALCRRIVRGCIMPFYVGHNGRWINSRGSVIEYIINQVMVSGWPGFRWRPDSRGSIITIDETRISSFSSVTSGWLTGSPEEVTAAFPGTAKYLITSETENYNLSTRTTTIAIITVHSFCNGQLVTIYYQRHPLRAVIRGLKC